MYTIQTGHGPLAIADERIELDAWALDKCLRWLARNDRNGEWSEYLADPVWAVRELGEFTVEQARAECWAQMHDDDNEGEN